MSLLRLTLKDFVIVSQLELDLSSGFTVLTGETGAGKSILIDALQLVLGGRADPGTIRDKQAKAEVSAEFKLTPEAREWLRKMELDDTEPTLLLRRTVDTQGRSKGWINSTATTAAQLREVGGLLVEIHGQHAWQGLMQPETTRALLDGYGRIDSAALLPLWQAWKSAREALDHARSHQTAALAEQDRLLWQIAELDKLEPTPAGWDQLQEEHDRLANVHALLEGAQAATGMLSEADDNAISLLSRATQQLRQRQHMEPRFLPLLQSLEQAALLTDEVARELNAYLRHTEADPTRLAEIDQKMGTWMSLSKRNRCTPEQLPQLYLEKKQQLAALSASIDTATLEANCRECEAVYMSSAKEISKLRHACQAQLAFDISAVMQRLGMVGGRFEVRLSALPVAQAFGLESVEFLVSGHTGAEAKPIAKVASGGELSRIALAIAVTTSQLGTCPTLIFDEVDSGVGGAVAHTVGKLMAALGQHRQVLTVTHLPQVAACANHHLHVSKSDIGGQVISRVSTLDTTARELEIARMLGGSQLSHAALNHAREMLAL